MPSATLATYAWDDLSRRSTLSLGNITSSTSSYNAQGSLASLTHDLTGTTNDLGFSYARNQTGEIITVNPINPQSNWMLANPPQSRSANGLNQYTTINSNAITHDANGNLQSDGLWTYGHDLDNRLVSAVRNNPASGVSLSYDPAGRLSRTVVDNQTTDLLYDGSDLIAEYDGAGNLTTRHIHGPGVDEPLVSMSGTTKTWRYADHLGSVIAEADAAGNAVAIRGYGPFGENGSIAPNRFGYTGQQYIAGLGLYYYKARWYSPTMGRFLETDPIGYGDDLNLYNYVEGNPLNRTDPRGEFWVGIGGAAVGGSAGAIGSAAAQYAQNGSVNWNTVGWNFVTGAVTGFALTTPGGATLLGAMGIGGAGGLATYGLTTPVSNWSAVGAVASTAAESLGGAIGGATANPYTFIKVSPTLNDSSLMTSIAISGATRGAAGSTFSGWDFMFPSQNKPQACSR